MDQDTFEKIITDPYDIAIFKTLWERKNLGARYNELYRLVNKKHKLPIKTFNVHLKKLVDLGLVEKIEKSRFNVRYRIRFFDEITAHYQKIIEENHEAFVEWLKESMKALPETKETAVRRIVESAVEEVMLQAFLLLWQGEKMIRKGFNEHAMFMLAAYMREAELNLAFVMNILSQLDGASSVLDKLAEEVKNAYLKRDP